MDWGCVWGLLAGRGACCVVVLLLISDKTYPRGGVFDAVLGSSLAGLNDLRSAAVGLVDA